MKFLCCLSQEPNTATNSTTSRTGLFLGPHYSLALASYILTIQVLSVSVSTISRALYNLIHMPNKTPGEQGQGNLRIFFKQELIKATNNFSSSNKIGGGRFGSVFKAWLQDGTLVALKVLSVEVESMRGEREFISELAALSNIRHENLVILQGCRVDGADRYLVYEYMENNRLAHTLLASKQNRMNLSWETRRYIASGVARGIAYLHEEVQPRILHRDIKASGVLLDKNFTSKTRISASRGFSETIALMSALLSPVHCYVAPEYAISGHLTRKADFYGFGVRLLEIMSGRSAVDFDLEHGEHYLGQKLCGIAGLEASKANKLLGIVDAILNLNFPQEEALRFLTVGLQETAKLRPKMSIAVKMLTNEIDIRDIEVSQPGHLSDLMEIKLHQRSSPQSTPSGTPP